MGMSPTIPVFGTNPSAALIQWDQTFHSRGLIPWRLLCGCLLPTTPDDLDLVNRPLWRIVWALSYRPIAIDLGRR
jgi:hypothetical protein